MSELRATIIQSIRKLLPAFEIKLGNEQLYMGGRAIPCRWTVYLIRKEKQISILFFNDFQFGILQVLEMMMNSTADGKLLIHMIEH